MKTPLVWICIGLTAGGGLRAAEEKTAVPFRALSFEAATAAAKNEGKLIFIDFYTTWCEPCKRLDAQTWTDAAVGQLIGDKAVALKLDAEKEGADVAKRFKVDAYPTLLLLKPDGTVADRLVGFREPAKFISEFNAALAGKPTLARAVDAVSVAQSKNDSVQARYDLGKTLMQQGDHAGALNEFLWCYDVGMPGTSFVGVRSSFLLSDIGRLAKVFPLAREALVERCDAAEKQMLADPADRQAATDFAALTTTLGDDERLVKAFNQLAPDDPRRRSFGLRIFRVMLPRQHYADALSAMPYDSMVRLFELNAKRPLPPGADPRMLDAMRRSSVGSMLDYIEVLAGAGDLEHARELIGKLLEYDAGEATQAELMARLKRAGQPNLLQPEVAKR
jgi:thiol-disulfide isomerase/thioredoxin